MAATTLLCGVQDTPPHVLVSLCERGRKGLALLIACSLSGTVEGAVSVSLSTGTTNTSVLYMGNTMEEKGLSTFHSIRSHISLMQGTI